MNYLWYSMGLHGNITDPGTNAWSIVQEAKSYGIDTRTSPYNWYDNMKIAWEIQGIKAKNPKARIAVLGESYGDNAVLAICNMLVWGFGQPVTVDLACGFQRSTKGGVQFKVPPNVVKAIEIYDSNIVTDKYGADPWALAPGNTVTQLQNIDIDAEHPGDFGQGRDIVMAAVKIFSEAP